MSARSALRGLGYVASEILDALWPAQAVRCALGRDYARAVTAAAAAHDAEEGLNEFEEANEVLPGYEAVSPDGYYGFAEPDLGPNSEHAEALRLNSDRGTGAIDDGDPQQVTLSGREYERYLCGALNDPPPRAQCLGCGGVDDGGHVCGRGRHCPCGSDTCGVCCNAGPQLPLRDSELAAVRRLMTVCDGVNFGRLSGGDYEPSLDDDELVAVRGLIQERYETLNGRMPQEKIPAGVAANGTAPAGPDLSPLANAGFGGNPAGVESPAPPAGVDPPSRTSPKGDGEGPAGDSGIRSSAPAGHPSFTDWAIPAIATVLSAHVPDWNCEDADEPFIACVNEFDSADEHYREFPDWQAWSEHAAKAIAAHIEAALTGEGKHVIVTKVYP